MASALRAWRGGRAAAGADGRRAARQPTASSAAATSCSCCGNGKPTPVWVRTGLTDLDYSEVVRGLAEGDSVLRAAQREPGAVAAGFKQRMNRMTGGGGVPGMRQTPRHRPSGAPATPAGPGR